MPVALPSSPGSRRPRQVKVQSPRRSGAGGKQAFRTGLLWLTPRCFVGVFCFFFLNYFPPKRQSLP